MATRVPLVMVTGALQQLQSADVIADPIGSVFSWSLNIGNASGQTIFYAPSQATGNTAEAARTIVVPFAGVLRNLYVSTQSAQPASGTLVLTISVNTTPSTVTVTFAINAPASTQSDTTHTIAVAAGDKVSVKAVNGASATSATIQSIAFQLTPT